VFFFIASDWACSQGIMGEAVTLLQQAAEILRTEPEMAQLLQDRVAKLSKELELE
jgi:F0F1-type ATP synthase delta subunit